jgi:hypothetical protein
VWASSGVASHDLFLTRDAANTLAQRNGTNAQIFRVYGTESSSLTNYERLFFKAVAGAAFQIGIENNGTGVARDLSVVVGGFTSTFTTSGEFHSATHVRVPPTGIIYWHQRARMLSSADGIIALYNSAMANFSRLQFGGTTASFPAWKRSGADIHAVLADDTGFTKIKGKHQTDADAVAETITPTHTLTLYDAAGTAYKVACVAA